MSKTVTGGPKVSSTLDNGVIDLPGIQKDGHDVELCTSEDSLEVVMKRFGNIISQQKRFRSSVKEQRKVALENQITK